MITEKLKNKFIIAARKTEYLDSEFVTNFMWNNNIHGQEIYNELYEELNHLISHD